MVHALIFVASVNRTGTIKNFATELFKNEWTVPGGREFRITGSVQAKAGPLSVGSTVRVWCSGSGLYMRAPLIFPRTLIVCFLRFFFFFQWVTRVGMMPFVSHFWRFRWNAYRWFWHNKANPDHKLKKIRRGLWKGVPSPQSRALQPLWCFQKYLNITWFLDFY